MENLICTVPAAPLRKEASHRSEMTSQILFGETMELLEVKDEWRLIKNHFDGYEGWLTEHLVAPVGEGFTTPPRFIAKSIVNSITSPTQLINIPMGSHLTGFDDETRLLWDETYKYHGTFRDLQKPFNEDLLAELVNAWMNAPYLWGGKTLMGVDCSGFVQTVFKVMGIPLLRDAYQQAGQGGAVPANAANFKKGDLAFFSNKDGKVVHVGILMSANTIAHASGKVRMDSFDTSGITNRENGKRTHTFHSVRRFY